MRFLHWLGPEKILGLIIRDELVSVRDKKQGLSLSSKYFSLGETLRMQPLIYYYWVFTKFSPSSWWDCSYHRGVPYFRKHTVLQEEVSQTVCSHPHGPMNSLGPPYSVHIERDRTIYLITTVTLSITSWKVS